jgi:HK97 gp10 family phage protein
MGAEIRLESHIAEFMKKAPEMAEKRMKEAVQEVRNNVLEKLSGERHGRTYTVPGTSRTYTASSPGEPPAQRTGELRQSISTEVDRTGGNIIGLVGTDKKYGLMLEKGTRDMAPRPWLQPSFEESEDEVIDIFSKPWEL